MIRNPLDNPLILRNYYQIKDADQVIAVGKMNRFGVLGGTKWAVQMGIDKQIPVFMFDQAGVKGETLARKWYQWHYPSEEWQLTAKRGSTPPTLTANTAGVGTRDLNSAGTRAIENLFKGFKDVKGINIYTGSEDPLGRVLTNPNWGLSAKDKKRFFDVETPYKKGRTGNLVKDKALMKSLMIKKFGQSPELIEQISKRGGVSFLQASEHITGKKDRWTGKAGKSNFINTLVDAYKEVNPSDAGAKGIIHSGGAKGADTLFEELGAKKGFEVQAHSFEGHKTKSTNAIIHTVDELKAARDPVYTAKASLDFDYNLRQQHIKVDKLRVQAAAAQTNILAALTKTTGPQIASSEGALKPDWAFRDEPNIYTEEGDIRDKPKKKTRGRGTGGVKSKILYQRDAVKLLQNDAFLKDLGLLRNTYRGFGDTPSLYAMTTAGEKIWERGVKVDNPMRGVGYGLKLPPEWEELLTSVKKSFEGLSESHLASGIPQVEEGARGLLSIDEKRTVERMQKAKSQIPLNRLEKAVGDIDALLNPGSATILKPGMDRAQFIENTSNMRFAGENTRDLAAEVRKVGEAERVRLGGGLQRAGTTLGAHAAKDLAEYEKFVKNRPRTGILQLMYPDEANAPRNLTGGAVGIPPFKGIDVTEEGKFIRFTGEDFKRKAQTKLPSDYFQTKRHALEPGTGQWVAPKQTPLSGGVAEEVHTTAQLNQAGEWETKPVGGKASTRTLGQLEAMRRGVALEPQRSLLPSDYFGEETPKTKPTKPKVPSLVDVGKAKVSGFVEEVKQLTKAKEPQAQSGYGQRQRMEIDAREHKRYLQQLPAPEREMARRLMKPTQFEAWEKAKKLAEIKKKKKFAKAWDKIKSGKNLKMLLPALLLSGLFGTMMSDDRNVA